MFSWIEVEATVMVIVGQQAKLEEINMEPPRQIQIEPI